TVFPENTTDKTIVWTSDNTSAVVVDDKSFIDYGFIKAISIGTATITATCGDVKATCLVTVVPTPAEGIFISQEAVSLEVGEDTMLSATVLPETTTDKNVVWTSDNSSVAVVDENGKITALSIGTATITASCGDVKATCLVTVVATPAESIFISQEAVSLKVGEDMVLSATVIPENTTDKSVIWTSDNSSVAVVDENGKITAISIGTATITVSCGDVKATCLVTVVATPAESIFISQEAVSLVVGEDTMLSATVLPETTTDKSVVWTSDNSSVAVVDENGKITAISIGTATVSASCGDVKADCIVTVVATPVESITISQDFAQLSIGESIRLTGIILPENASDKTIIWSSSDESIALVDVEGNVTAIGGGEVDIIATSAGNSTIKAICHVIVNPLMVESIVLSPYFFDCLPGENFYITAKVYPENATDRTLSWSSSDDSIAIVDSNGYVMALAPGNVIITAKANDGSDVGAICSVTVTPILIESIQLTPENLNGEEGHFYKIEATVLPENATEKTLIWSSSDESVTAINSEGVVYILKEGECVITATASDGSGVTAECIVTVVAGIDSIFSDNGNFDIYSVNGLLIRKGCDNDYLKTLAPDVYIIRQGNLTKKLIIH
ncbi:MAG: Ig-like domain-containing protein, partial [Muribaculaceae bacterium]|nr:Ig-like domain-containing protein [Muribaculaceae bacterium]